MQLELSYDLISKLVKRSEYGLEFAENFGGRENDHTCTGVIVADSWESLERAKLIKGYDSTRLGRQLEDQGVAFVFSDEYSIHYGGVGDTWAYRTQADSYFWEPEAMYDGDGGMFTIDDDPGVILDCLYNTADLTTGGTYYRGLPKSWLHTITDSPIEGFSVEQHTIDTHYTGWHQGMNDNPQAIIDAIDGDDIYLALVVYQPSQFYSEWQVWLVREIED